MNRKRKKAGLLTTSKPISKNRIAWVVLILVMIFTGLIRYRLLSVPMERDEGEYAYAGQLILEGVPPYQEVYNMKLPGIYAIYAVIMVVFGQTHQGIHAGLLLANEATLLFVFLLARRLFNLPAAAASAAIFALLSVSESVEGVFANAEHFVIVFAVGGLLMLWHALSKDSLWRIFVAGILLGIAFIMKQHGLAFGAAGGVYILLDAWGQKPVPWRKLILRLLSLTGGIVVVVAGLCLVMVWAGVFKKFWFWTVDYARTYVAQVPLSEAWNSFTYGFSPIAGCAVLLWILIGFGIGCLVTRTIHGRARRFLLVYAILSFAAICPGFYFRPHYFVLLLPCAALLGAAAIYAISQWLSRIAWLSKLVPAILIIICLGQAAYQQRQFLFLMTPTEACRAAYSINPFPESLEIASFIRSHTAPNDTIAILGSEPQICFYSQRRSASGYIYMYPLMENHSFALQMQKDFIRETEVKKPKYLVFVNVPLSWLRRSDSHNLLFEWADQYQKNFRVTGVTAIYGNQTVYHWAPDVPASIDSPFSVVIFERNVNP